MAISSKRPSAGKPAATLQDLAKEPSSVRLSIVIDKETHRRLKVKAAESDTTISDIIRQMVDTHLNNG